MTVVPLRLGQVLLVPAEKLDNVIDELGQRVLDQNRDAIDMLTAYDRGEIEVAAK